MTWGDLLDHFDLVAQDLQDIGINVWDRALMASMPGLWLRSNIAGLLSRPPSGYLEERVDEERIRRIPIYATRVQEKFWGPQASTA